MNEMNVLKQTAHDSKLQTAYRIRGLDPVCSIMASSRTVWPQKRSEIVCKPASATICLTFHFNILAMQLSYEVKMRQISRRQFIL